MRPKRPQEAPKRPPETPKRPQEVPKMPPRGPKRRPRGTQEAPKRRPRASQEPQRDLFGSPLALFSLEKSILTSMLCFTSFSTRFLINFHCFFHICLSSFEAPRPSRSTSSQEGATCVWTRILRVRTHVGTYARAAKNIKKH